MKLRLLLVALIPILLAQLDTSALMAKPSLKATPEGPVVAQVYFRNQSDWTRIDCNR